MTLHARGEAAPSDLDDLPWSRRYARRLAFTDLIAVAWAMGGTQLLWFGLDETQLSGSRLPLGFTLTYTLVSIALTGVWMLMLSLYATRDPRIVGGGAEEYKRIVDGAIRLFGVMAIVAVLFQWEISRGYFLTGLPTGLIALLASRWIWRQWLNAERIVGRSSSRVIVVGAPVSVGAITRELKAKISSGYIVVGACIVREPRAGEERWAGPGPAEIGLDSLPRLLEVTGADTVLITSADELTAERVREISWGLEPGRHHLIVAPSLTDVGGPRIHMRPVAGLPLIHVETPRYAGVKRFSKRAFDVVGSAMLLVALTPVIVAIALSVAFGSRGPVLFRQRRVGLNGESFSMLKFRSMVVDAEDRLAELAATQRDAGNAVLFKLTNDPRVTPVGRLLRRYSLDELPQLLNVLRGDMSLVGPRPPLETEVAAYEKQVHRRFLVKPGITGLWQVSGRSTLSWEDSVRLDLYYVENWSITSDVIVLWRTVREVVRPRGAF